MTPTPETSVPAEEPSTPLEEVPKESIQPVQIVVEPENTDDVLINPGKGFVFLGYLDESEYDADFRSVVSIGYTRFNWAKIEPEEGHYDWDHIDDWINTFKRQDKQFAFGVMCANTSSSKAYVTPEWVYDAGAEGKWITAENGEPQKIPNWTDPIFLEKLDNFIQALAKRYDGNPDISFIDIRSYGNWGEQHTYKIEDAYPDISAEELRDLYFIPYMNAFQKTQLVAPYGLEEYEETYRWAIDRGVTIRRDGIVTYSDGSEGRMVYGKAPAIFEYPASYLREARSSGNWQYSAVRSVVETGAPTYLQIYEDMYDSNQAFYNEIANRIGYYFRLKKAVYYNALSSGTPADIELTFRNDGVAPLYASACLKVGLLDENGNLVQAYPVSGNPAQWMPGVDVAFTVSPILQLPAGQVQPVQYQLAVGLFEYASDTKPAYQLGSAGSTKDHWYVLGTITILPE